MNEYIFRISIIDLIKQLYQNVPSNINEEYNEQAKTPC